MCIDSHGCHCHNVKKWPKQHQKKWDRVYWRYLQASVSSYSTVDQYAGLTLDWPCIYPWSTRDQPSINTLVDAQSRLNWLLGWQLTNFHWCTLVRSTLGWLSIKLLIKRWSQVDWGYVNWHSITDVVSTNDSKKCLLVCLENETWDTVHWKCTSLWFRLILPQPKSIFLRLNSVVWPQLLSMIELHVLAL